MRRLLCLVLAPLGVAACSPQQPRLEQPVGLTTVRAASLERADARQPQAGEAEPSGGGPRSARATELLPSFLFVQGSAVISPAQNEELRRIAARMTTGALRGATLIAVGHSDPVGGSLQNLELGLERAITVKQLLVAHGAPSGLVIAASSGDLATPADWPGRRVDLIVVPAPPKGAVQPAPIAPECIGLRDARLCQ